ncbi:hypothetical protein O5O45_26470 [Hahella aquimaris]|uniref:hypothetical protein n=1 Tax=Hahella sp. HNIBRBA332 TaxID=3015983 RepID=UPI00273BCEBF|nr:hypothetical protein [Hahella sp. HNIBRBA332]WLQ13276.1 hypothetical protein O5O45_26470 [Hahella sp. HNIBRBA332]
MNASFVPEDKSHPALFLIIRLTQADEPMGENEGDFPTALFSAHILWRNGLNG